MARRPPVKPAKNGTTIAFRVDSEVGEQIDQFLERYNQGKDVDKLNRSSLLRRIFQIGWDEVKKSAPERLR